MTMILAIAAAGAMGLPACAPTIGVGEYYGGKDSLVGRSYSLAQGLTMGWCLSGVLKDASGNLVLQMKGTKNTACGPEIFDFYCISAPQRADLLTDFLENVNCAQGLIYDGCNRF